MIGKLKILNVLVEILVFFCCICLGLNYVNVMSFCINLVMVIFVMVLVLRWINCGEKNWFVFCNW